MAQFGRPSADTTVGAYTNQAGSASSIFNTIDESSFDDADYIRTELNPASGSAYVTKLTSITDPVSSSGHTVRYRYKKDASGGAQMNLTSVQLRQGYVSEGSQGTLIASTSHTNISDTVTAGSITLSGAEADAITNYADLYLRFVFTQV